MLSQRASFVRALILLVPVCCLLSGFRAQKDKIYPFDKWTAAELQKANTAKNVSYLSAEEKQVVFYTNLARINPKLFGETYAQRYIDSLELRSGYTSSLLGTLKKTAAMPALLPDSVLTATAADHAEASGKKGTIGHAGGDKRTAKVKGRFAADVWGENCSYGRPTPLSIVMQLLIDEDTPSLGHRKNILNPAYTHIGTAIRPHKKYVTNCVQDFGG